MSGIVWLASYPKSGNTWLRSFLYHVVRLMHGIPLEDDELNRLTKVTVHEASLFQLFDAALGKSVADATIEEISAVRPGVQEQISRLTRNRALVKTHNAIAEVEGFPTINPDVSVGAVYLIRDPRDVAVSFASFMRVDLDRAIEVLNGPSWASASTTQGPFELWGSWTENVTSWTDSDNEVLVVRYEDMRADPHAAFRQIVSYLRMKATDAMVDEATRLSSFERLSAAERAYPPVEGVTTFFRKGQAGGWREAMTAEQAARVTSAHGSTMARWGYV